MPHAREPHTHTHSQPMPALKAPHLIAPHLNSNSTVNQVGSNRVQFKFKDEREEGMDVFVVWSYTNPYVCSLFHDVFWFFFLLQTCRDTSVELFHCAVLTCSNFSCFCSYSILHNNATAADTFLTDTLVCKNVTIFRWENCTNVDSLNLYGLD